MQKNKSKNGSVKLDFSQAKNHLGVDKIVQLPNGKVGALEGLVKLDEEWHVYLATKDNNILAPLSACSFPEYSTNFSFGIDLNDNLDLEMEVLLDFLNNSLDFPDYLDTYQDRSKETCADLGSRELNLFHMVTGMTSELPEILDAADSKEDLSDELSDCMFYLANYLSFREKAFGHFEQGFNSLKAPREFITDYLNLTYDVCQLTDLVKKHCAYGKEIPTDRENEIVSNIVVSVASIMKNNGIDYKTSLENNIKKLQKRFSDKKFDKNAAINKNEKLEKDITNNV